jgi:hypothetical protein
MNRPLPSWLVPALAGLLFLLTGMALIPALGFRTTNCSAPAPIFSPGAAFYSLDLGKTKIPFMVMSCSGALKTWLFAGLFQFLAPL